MNWTTGRGRVSQTETPDESKTRLSENHVTPSAETGIRLMLTSPDRAGQGLPSTPHDA